MFRAERKENRLGMARYRELGEWERIVTVSTENKGRECHQEDSETDRQTDRIRPTDKLCRLHREDLAVGRHGETGMLV